MRLSIFVICGLIAAIVVIVIGVSISEVADTGRFCSGQVVDADWCANARLRQSIFGSTVAGAGIVAAAIVCGAAVLAPRTSSDPAVVGVMQAED